MLRAAKRLVLNAAESAGYRITKIHQAAPAAAPEPPPIELREASKRTGKPIPPKMLDPRYPGSEDIPLYIQHYGAETLLRRPFYNIGSAWNKHSCWTNVDHPSAWYDSSQAGSLDLAWDISTLEPIGVESRTAEAVYSSHTIEHLLNHHVDHVFNEAYRILKPGGFLRVTCPNIYLYYEPYRRKAPHLTLYGDAYPRYSMQDLFLNEFASQLSDIMRTGNPDGAGTIKIPDAEVDRIFDTLPFDEACDHFTAMCGYELHKKAPGAHINWWHHEKVEQFMRRAGFTHVRRSAYKQSFCPAMRGEQFDTTSPRFSLYMEAER